MLTRAREDVAHCKQVHVLTGIGRKWLSLESLLSSRKPRKKKDLTKMLL